MKLRAGFVSNSSSASFIITFNIDDIEMLYEIIAETDISNCTPGTIREILEDDINRETRNWKKKEKERARMNRDFAIMATNSYMEQLTKKQRIIKLINELNNKYNQIITDCTEGEWCTTRRKDIQNIELRTYKLYLLLHRVSLHINLSSKKVTIEGWTSMYNDATDIPIQISQLVIGYTIYQQEHSISPTLEIKIERDQ